MSRVTRPIYLTETGNAGGSNGGELMSAVLTPAAAVSTLVVRQGGAGGTVILTLQAAANGGSVQARFEGLGYSGQLHATLTGAGALATIEL
jgi:hypothetical protein